MCFNYSLVFPTKTEPKNRSSPALDFPIVMVGKSPVPRKLPGYGIATRSDRRKVILLAGSPSEKSLCLVQSHEWTAPQDASAFPLLRLSSIVRTCSNSLEAAGKEMHEVLFAPLDFLQVQLM